MSRVFIIEKCEYKTCPFFIKGISYVSEPYCSITPNDRGWPTRDIPYNKKEWNGDFPKFCPLNSMEDFLNVLRKQLSSKVEG